MFPGTVALSGSPATVIAGTVTVAHPSARESATDVALMVTCRSLAGGAGAVYVVATPLAVDVGETLPHDPVGQDHVHLTPLLLGSWSTAATSWAVPLASTVPDAGETATVI